MPIVISGIDETLNILSADPSIANRFKPLFLPRWKEERMEEIARIILSLEPQLLLKKPSQVMDEEVLLRLMVLSEGLLGEVVAILRLFAEWAIRTGTESIDGKIVTRENLLAMGYVMPSDRSRHSG